LATNLTAGVADATETPTLRARRSFLERARRIPDISVSVFGDVPEEQTFLVAVPSLWSPEAEAVIELEGDVMREFPGSRLLIRVQGLKERDGGPAGASQTR
jgi:hypothetical protein